MQKQIALTEARAKLSEIINEVMSGGDTYIISKLGKPAVALVPVELWEQWQQENRDRVDDARLLARRATRRNRVSDLIQEMQKQSAAAPAGPMDDDEWMETINELIEEVRTQSQAKQE